MITITEYMLIFVKYTGNFVINFIFLKYLTKKKKKTILKAI